MTPEACKVYRVGRRDCFAGLGTESRHAAGQMCTIMPHFAAGIYEDTNETYRCMPHGMRSYLGPGAAEAKRECRPDGRGIPAHLPRHRDCANRKGDQLSPPQRRDEN